MVNEWRKIKVPPKLSIQVDIFTGSVKIMQLQPAAFPPYDKFLPFL